MSVRLGSIAASADFPIVIDHDMRVSVLYDVLDETE